ncbi:hypothetical protein B0H16DRAFT_1542685 [Mycena metata]|uniref:Transposase n=1 Tax=Mycena metata TaxID=1033252 RepID=A0AAD7NBA8_9AGAR|nr:hypothetical protein B0H16DRAFT_1542685 [Mycena metata]
MWWLRAKGVTVVIFLDNARSATLSVMANLNSLLGGSIIWTAHQLHISYGERVRVGALRPARASFIQSRLDSFPEHA